MRLYPHRTTLFACLILQVVVSSASEFTGGGADDCLPCHWQGSPKPAVAIFATAHGARSDPAAPFGGLQCESCHGPGEDHASAQRRGENVRPEKTFGRESSTPAVAQNAACLECHDSGSRHGWAGSAHEREDVPCAACHRVHVERDPVFDAMAQQAACFECHPRRRADTFKASAHPLRFGAMSCSSCHDPHNADNDHLLKEATVNDTCFVCHAEKRGPYLWEHAPASEDCALCHQPHGSNHPVLLTRRPPLLCQQCHAAETHPSLALTSNSIGDPATERFLLGRACLNCHSQVHGSNHPSGATLTR